MDFYFLTCGTLFILTLFNVFESVLKANKLNRWLTALVFLLSAVFAVVGDINIIGLNISLNLILYIVCFAYLLIKNFKIKSLLFMLIACLITISVLVCYNAINFENYIFAFVQPYVYFALGMGIVLYYVCNNVSTAFCGTLMGVVLFEYVFHKTSIKLLEETLVLGKQYCLTFTLISMLSYCLINTFVYILKGIKIRKQQKNQNLIN